MATIESGIERRPRGEEVLEHLVWEQPVALAVPQRVDRRRIDDLIAEALGAVQQIGLPRCQAEGH